MSTQLADYDYSLPEELIAQEAIEPRDAAKLLVYRLTSREISHHHVHDLDQLLNPHDLMVLNRSKVIPARLHGHKPSGGALEVLLVHSEQDQQHWRCLVRGKVRPGTSILFEQAGTAEVLACHDDGERSLRFDRPALEIADTIGHMPLPPYIKRADTANDHTRYQTVWADTPGSVAAPTASLHFTEALLDRLTKQGVGQTKVDLAVGPGTFQPVQVEDFSKHDMHKEFCICPQQAVDDITTCRQRGGRVIAIGTTVVRTLEHAASEGELKEFEGWTRIFLHPPYQMQVVEGLLTNFHLPRSTLLMLVACLTGRDELQRIYAEAIKQSYRFYSYGDAMLILPE